MGILNAYAWRASVDYQAMSYQDSAYRINYEEWNNLLNCSKNGELAIVVATDWLNGYLVDNWPGAFHTDVTLRTYRKQHLELGLFCYDIDNRPKGAYWGKLHGVPNQATATPPLLEKVDLDRILIFYQVLDQVRRSRIDQKLKNSEDITSFHCMPEHGGMVMVELYNALNVSDFRGNVGNLDIVAEPVEEAVPAVRLVIFGWKYNLKNHLHRNIWKKLVTGAGYAAKQAKKITVAIAKRSAGIASLVEPMGTLEEVPY